MVTDAWTLLRATREGAGMFCRSTWSRALVVLVASLLVSAACVTGNTTPSGSPQSGSAQQEFLIVEATEGPLTNPVWASYNSGFDAAAKAFGAKSKYLGTPAAVTDVDALLKLIRDGVAMKPDAMIITDNRPASEDALIKEVTGAGMPVLLFGTEADPDKVGALGWLGRDNVETGKTGGLQLKALGCKNVLNVALIPGQATYSDDTTFGLAQTFKGKITNADLPVAFTSNASAISGAVKALLLKDTSIDCVFTVGTTLYAGMVAGIDGLGDRTAQLSAHTGTAVANDVSFADLLTGKIAFALNSQPFYIGYMAFAELYAHVRWGVTMNKRMAIDGQVVTKANAQKILENFKANGFY